MSPRKKMFCLRPRTLAALSLKTNGEQCLAQLQLKITDGAGSGQSAAADCLFLPPKDTVDVRLKIIRPLGPGRFTALDRGI